MDVFKIYFQRLSYNGQDYTKGRFLDPQQEMGLYCRSITLSPMQDMKDNATLDWPGEDGVDVYVPGEIIGNAVPRMKSYDLNISFVWEGNDSDWKQTLDAFISFLKGGRLCYYDEFVKNGRKDVVLKRFEHDALYRNSMDGITIFSVSASFLVGDPKTNVLPTVNQQGQITGLEWQN